MIDIHVGDRWTRLEGLFGTALIDVVSAAPEPPFEIKNYMRSVPQNLLYLEQWAAERTVQWHDPQNRLFEAKGMRFLGNLRNGGPTKYDIEFPFKTKPDDYQLKFFAHARTLTNIALAPAALGCVDANTEYLSPTGWRRIADYSGDGVAQYHPHDGSIDFVDSPKFVKLPCAEMIRFKTTRGVDQLLSPEHRVLLADGEVVTAEFIEQWWSILRPDKLKFRTTFIVGERTGICLTPEQIRLQVAVNADGYLHRSDTHPNHNRMVAVRVKKDRKKARLRSLLKNAGVTYRESVAQPEGFSLFYFSAPWEKGYGDAWWNATREQLELVANEVTHWDGSFTKSEGESFFTTDKTSADFIQYAFSSTGRRTSCRFQDRRREGRDSIDWLVHASNRPPEAGLLGSGLKGVVYSNISREPSPDGFKYCFMVPSTFLLLRRNGCIFATGNTGKTKMLLDVAADKFLRGEIDGVAVIAPNGVHRQWITKGVPVHLSDAVPRLAHVWSPTRKMPRDFALIENDLIKRLRILTFNVEAFSSATGKARKMLANLMSKARWFLIFDECFLAGTQVATPAGAKSIETITVGDIVLSSVGPQRVKSTFQGLTNRFVILHLSRGTKIRCTENHPFFTEVGWVPAANMTGRYVSSDEDVRRVWGTISTPESQGSSKAAILWEILFSEVAHAPTGSASCRVHSRGGRENSASIERAPFGAADMEPGQTITRNHSTENVGDITSDETQTLSSRRQWSPSIESASSFDRDHGATVDCGTRHRIGSEAQRLSDLLQSRLGSSQEEVGYRSRRRRTSSDDQTNAGSQEGEKITRTWVVRVEVVECLHPVVTYDLELEGAPHFYAEGALVHNSQRGKNPRAERTKQIDKVARLAVARANCTATPVTRNFTDFYSQYHILDERIIGLSHFIAFRNRYCITIPVPGAPRGAVKIVGHRNVEELFRRIAPVTFMIPASVLNLKEPWRETVEVVLTDEQRDVYGLLAEKMVFDLKAQNIESPSNALTRLLRLQQVLCGRVYEEGVDEDGVEIAVPRFIPSNRPAALIQFLEDYDGAAVIWARFQQDIDDISTALVIRGQKAAKSESDQSTWRHTTYDGRVTKVAEREARVAGFARGDFDYFLGNPAAGGTGVDGLQDSCSLSIYYSNSFNREIRWQSEGRIQRRGQKNHVGIVDLVVSNSVDELFLEAYSSTEELANMVMRSPEILTRGL